MKPLNKRPDLYSRVWRWHFFAGLFVAPFAIVLAVTGAIYLFTPQFNAFSESQIHNSAAPVDGVITKSPEEVLSQVLDRYPEYLFHRVRLARDDDKSYEFDLKAHEQSSKPAKLRVWVSAATGQIMATGDPDSHVPEFVKRIHGELLSGKPGSLVVELVACWFIILMVTGLYLYWPRNVSWRSVFFPSLNKRGRTLLLALHGSIAAWASVVILIFLFSGLPWTQVWGNGFKQVQDYLGIPSQGQEWKVNLKSGAKPNDVTTGMGLNGAIQLAQNESLSPPVFVMPPKHGGVWTVRSLHPNRANRVTIHFDQWTGQELMRVKFADKHWFKRLVSHAISLHEGHLFGPLNQALGVLVALCVIAISLTGPLMWWRRRPTGELATPKVRPDQKLSIAMGAVIFVLAAFLPLVAISIFAVLLVDVARALLSRTFTHN